MTDLQTIECLCSVIEQQAALIRELVTELKQAKAFSDEDAEKLYMLEEAYKSAVGDSAV